jgi:hypothetical protein
MDTSKFQPLIDHFGETPPNAGQLFMICVTTDRKELFFPAVAAFLILLDRIDIMEKEKIVRKMEERIEYFS